jgi:L-rhamnose mutarotase
MQVGELANDSVNVRWQNEMAPMMAKAHEFSGESSDRLALIFQL